MAGDLHPSSTHPPLPPTTEENRFLHLRLLRSRRVGATTYRRLLTEHGTVQNALAALPKVARAAGVSDYEVFPEDRVAAELSAGHKLGAKLLLLGDPDYPDSLAELEAPPPILWAHGDTSLLKRPMLAMVGARNSSALGARMAKALTEDLGTRGYVIVSGLARGIDAAAHAAALENGTIAVLAGGVDVTYPAENAALMDNIAKKGLLLSEQPIGLQPIARHFPARNRIIAGLGRATIVIEAAARSGSLITAREAIDFGRDVLAVPGHPFDARSAGCNLLIRDGAILVRSADDVAEALAPLAEPEIIKAEMGDPVSQPDLALQSATPPGPQTKALHREILSKLGPTPIAEDQLIRDLATTPAIVTPLLTELELSGDITRHSGGLISKH